MAPGHSKRACSATGSLKVFTFELASPPDSTCRNSLPLGTYGQSSGVCFPSNANFISSAQYSCSNTAGFSSPNTGLFFLSGLNVDVDVPSGFQGSLSFTHTNPYQQGSVAIFDGPGGTGAVLATGTIPSSGGPGCFGAGFCPFFPFTLSFLGVARSVRLSGVADQIVFDDFQFGSSGGSTGDPHITPFRHTQVPFTLPAARQSLDVYNYITLPSFQQNCRFIKYPGAWNGEYVIEIAYS